MLTNSMYDRAGNQSWTQDCSSCKLTEFVTICDYMQKADPMASAQITSILACLWNNRLTSPDATNFGEHTRWGLKHPKWFCTTLRASNIRQSVTDLKSPFQTLPSKHSLQICSKQCYDSGVTKCSLKVQKLIPTSWKNTHQLGIAAVDMSSQWCSSWILKPSGYVAVTRLSRNPFQKSNIWY